ncbi:hypothetical protein [Sphingomonas sp. SAFR-052]|uniref:hypothetical protein n=1 Tax=Sphingomonas sp. SAFR-052 TaxID=3436867 RepID=UPI003F7F543F
MHIGLDHDPHNFSDAIHVVPDPLMPDTVDDQIVTLSQRQLARIVLVAVECGGRFQRDAMQYDPLAWMFAPRAIFGGVRSVDAVMDLNNCERALILHGLGMLDGEIEFVDDLRDTLDEDNVAQPVGHAPRVNSVA